MVSDPGAVSQVISIAFMGEHKIAGGVLRSGLNHRRQNRRQYQGARRKRLPHNRGLVVTGTSRQIKLKLFKQTETHLL